MSKWLQLSKEITSAGEDVGEGEEEETQREKIRPLLIISVARIEGSQ